MTDKCKGCKNRKEKWERVREEGTEFTMFTGYYCALNECEFEDFDPKEGKFVTVEPNDNRFAEYTKGVE